MCVCVCVPVFLSRFGVCSILSQTRYAGCSSQKSCSASISPKNAAPKFWLLLYIVVLIRMEKGFAQEIFGVLHPNRRFWSVL